MRVIIHILKRNNLYFHFSILEFYIIVFLIFGCSKKEIIRERTTTPIITYEKYEHGISPKSTVFKIYDDGYLFIKIKDEFSGKLEKRVKQLSKEDLKELINIFVDKDFLDIEPINMPAIYGGVVITIIFNYEGRSNTIKFLEGTKIPLSVERCLERLQKTVTRK